MDKYIMSILVCVVFTFSTVFILRVFYHFYQENVREAQVYHELLKEKKEIYFSKEEKGKTYIQTQAARALATGDMLWDVQYLLK